MLSHVLPRFQQFRVAEQRPGTPLYERLQRQFRERCAAEEAEKQRRLAALVKEKRAPIPKVHGGTGFRF